MATTTYGTQYAQSSDLVSNWPGVSLAVADRLDDVSFKGNGLNDQTGTTYTLVLTDAGKTVTLNNASAVTVTVPTNASVAYETGTCIYFTNKGAGVVTISAAGGVTLNNSSTLAQNSSCYIQKLDTNTWVMVIGPASGLTYITQATFSAVSSVNVNNCFSSTYDTYLVKGYMTASVQGDTRIRMRVGGTDNSTAGNYLYAGAYVRYITSTTVTGANSSTTATGFNVLGADSATSYFEATFFEPFATRLTGLSVTNIYNRSGPTDGFWQTFGGALTVTTSYDGFSLVPASGTITGFLRIYGLRNS